MFSWLRKWLVLLLTSGDTRSSTAAAPVTKVTLTVSTAHNQNAFSVTTSNPATEAKDTFIDFEQWYANTRGSEHYMLKSDNFKIVVCRRFIAGYSIFVHT